MNESASSATRKKSSKRRKLPPPPPPPAPETPLTPQEDFLVYLDHLHQAQKSFAQSSSTFLATEGAFDHLDKLYKLMDQMLELREQNVKLYRRVRDLEHVNNLEKMRKELDVNEECPELEKDTAFAETILESILEDTKSKRSFLDESKGKRPFSEETKGKKSPLEDTKLMGKRASSKKKIRRESSPNVELEPDSSGLTAKRPESGFSRRFSSCGESTRKQKQAKVSKWTKVKAAFKWEKAGNGIGDGNKGQDGPICGVEGQILEVARYLRVPSTTEEHGGHISGDSGSAEIFMNGSVSTNSSMEDFHNDSKSLYHDSSDEFSPQTHSKEKSSQHINKHHHHKTPWAKMKDIIQTRNSVKKKHRLSNQSDDIQIDVELCSDNDDNVFEDEKKTENIAQDIVDRYQKSRAENQSITRWHSVKKAFLEAPKRPENDPKTIEDEIQKNYRELQKRLSLEFQEKLHEWERIRQHSPSTSVNQSSNMHSSDTEKDPLFMKKIEEWQKIKAQPSIKLQNEDHLPPEFRKKLQEWEKKKSCRKKSYETPRWKSIKADHSIEYSTLSEEFRRKLEEWKQIKAGCYEEDRVEDSPPKPKKGVKKEVLIQTPTGCHRFEGISRKFTRKLYEWEKAKGIGPESSTVALLNNNSATVQENPNLTRSKSADSIAVSALNLTCPLISQPSSLSLNNVRDLEYEEEPDIEEEGQEENDFEAQNREGSEEEEEPEALIIEVEDIVEETAAPLETYRQKIQQPIYQRETIKSMCEGETLIRPKVRRSESTRAQNNYDLIENIFGVLQKIADAETEIQKIHEVDGDVSNKNLQSKLKVYDDIQKTCCTTLSMKIAQLQEANNKVLSNMKHDLNQETQDVVEVLQDLSSEIYYLGKSLTSELHGRKILEMYKVTGARCLNPILETVKEMRSKILEVRRKLSYICAASDVTAPRSKNVRKRPTRLYLRSESGDQSQGAVKKRIKCRQKSLQKTTVQDSDEDDQVSETKHRKLARTKSIHCEEDLEKIPVIPTKTDFIEFNTENEPQQNDTPVTVFVKTTRKFFSPVVEAPFTPVQATCSISEVNDELDETNKTVSVLSQPTVETDLEVREINVTGSSSEISDLSSITRTFTGGSNDLPLEVIKPVKQLPPTPPAPKKFKEISPGIRHMLNKYNKKISESSKSIKSGSSGSASPVAWRSPTFERRVKIQTELYQEGLEKSASASQIPKSPSLGIVKSSSASTVAKSSKNAAVSADKTKLADENCSSSKVTKGMSSKSVNEAQEEPNDDSRLQKLQKAKQNFFKSSQESDLNFPARNRLSQISVGSESSYESAMGLLVKSASVGMISINADAYKQLEGHASSLPRTGSKKKSAFAHIASKFRKIKMRKGKESKMNAVSALCRQSLVVDIQNGGGNNGDVAVETAEKPEQGKGGWMKRQKLFRK